MAPPQAPRPRMETQQNQAITPAFDALGAQAAQYVDPGIFSSSSAPPTHASLSPTPPASAPHSAAELYAIKASVCNHHLRYDSSLPWSGTCLDFDIRYCEACREREQFMSRIVAVDPAAGIGMLDLDVDVDVEMGEMQVSGFEDVEMETQVAEFEFEEANVEAEVGKEENDLVVASAKVAKYLPMFCPEGFTASPEAMDADESLVAEEFDGRRVRFLSGLRGEKVFGGNADESDGSSKEYQYLSEDSEPGAALIGEEGRDSLSEYEGDDEADEPMSPDIGVSFSRQHIWVGEELDL